MPSITLRLDEETVFQILHAVAQSSCRYERPYDDKPLSISMLHCCDYNETVHALLNQLSVFDIEDDGNASYLEILRAEYRETIKDLKESEQDE